MISSVIPARMEFSCGHFALVSLPRLKGESAAKRTERVNGEKVGARGRVCDFCGQREQAVVEVRPVQDALPSEVLNGHHVVDEKENLMHSAETPSVTRLGADETRRTFPPRRRLDAEQEREVTRLYAETTTSVPQISKQFGIGQSSVYRIAQRHGAGVRGRTAPAESTPSVTPPAQPVTPQMQAPAPASPAVARRAAPRAKAAARPTPVARKRNAPVATSALQRYEIRFSAETVVQASDISGVLRQLESLGATDVLSIVLTQRARQ
jgi:transposase-like protein